MKNTQTLFIALPEEKSLRYLEKLCRFLKHPKTLALVGTITVFIIDLLIPPGTAVGVLYLASMSFVYSQSKRTIVLFASVSSLLIVLELCIFYHNDHHYSVFSDYIFSLIAIWIACLALLRYQILRMKNMSQSEQHIKAIEEMLFLTSHKVRRPVCTLQGLMQLLKENPDQENLNKIADYIKISVEELDTFTKELNKFMQEEIKSKSEN